MLVKPIKTHKITTEDHSLILILDKYVPELKDGSILVVTSKIISVCQGRVIKKDEIDKMDLIKKESQKYIPPQENRYNVAVTISGNMLVASAGVDESNGNGYYILWPEKPYQVANEIRSYLKNRFKIKNLGVIITDSKTTPLRWGVTGVGLAYSGFKPLNDLIGTKDIFGRELKMTKVSVLDGLAASAAVVMGEGAEQTPIAVIEEVPFVQFQDQDPTQEEIDSLKIEIEDDLYAQFFKNINWQKGEK